jgi:hypothetical protein
VEFIKNQVSLALKAQDLGLETYLPLIDFLFRWKGQRYPQCLIIYTGHQQLYAIY